ncbi:MAG: DNA polymerase III subunit gamma/tau [Gammaproteobacteria bacterium]|nr:DNA polymerase III subunit gamma/tau [Gammaproteobacteria bacterium]
MSYQVLARRWRPRNFEQVVGQEHVLRALINALNSQRLHHAYLFSGTRGVGKTTLARILAKSLNCESGVTATPCGVCSACQSIDEGRFVDLIEVDAASRTKVEETRELLENVPYAPTQGRYKVYLIDEVHMFSNHSFNALLKTLEEPPPHVKFLLATTDPQKLPVTVLSRCLQFNLKSLPAELIAPHLQTVLGKEEIEFDELALRQLAKAAQGSMRDALSLLDQAIAFGNGTVRDADVSQMLGSIHPEKLLGLLSALIGNDAEAILAAIAVLAQSVPDYESVLEELLKLIHQLVLAQVVPSALDHVWLDSRPLLALAKQVSAEELQLYYQIGLNGRKDLPLAPSQRLGLEMILLRMLVFRPAAPVTKQSTEMPLVGRAEPEKKPSMTPAEPVVTSVASVPVAPVMSPNEGMSRGEMLRAALHPEKKKPVAEVKVAPKTKLVVSPTVAPVSTAVPIPAPVAKPLHSKGGGNPAQSWAEIIEAAHLRGLPYELATHCVLLEKRENVLRLQMNAEHGHLQKPRFVQGLTAALSDYYQHAVTLRFEQGAAQNEVQGETPAQRRQRLVKERQQAAEQAIMNDSNVQALQQQFGAEVVAGSVRPRDE